MITSALLPSLAFNSTIGDSFVSYVTSHSASAFDATSDIAKAEEQFRNESWDGMIKYLARISDQNLEHYFQSEIIAANFTRNGTELQAKGYFNNEAIHSPPLALTAITNTMLKYVKCFLTFIKRYVLF